MHDHDIYHAILKNRKINRIILPIEAIYCVWLAMTLVFNFKWFAYPIDAQFVLISLFFSTEWIFNLIKKRKAHKSKTKIN